MMEAMGMVEIGINGVLWLNGDQQVRQEEDKEESELQQVMGCLDTLEVQVGVIDSNVGELTSMAHEMNSSLYDIRHDIIMLNQNLMAYFQSQNFFPPSFPPHDQGPHQWRFKKFWLDNCVLCLLSL